MANIACFEIGSVARNQLCRLRCRLYPMVFIFCLTKSHDFPMIFPCFAYDFPMEGPSNCSAERWLASSTWSFSSSALGISPQFCNGGVLNKLGFQRISPWFIYNHGIWIWLSMMICSWYEFFYWQLLLMGYRHIQFNEQDNISWDIYDSL